MQLQYRLDDSINIDGTSYTVNASYDVILKVKDLMQDDEIVTASKVVVGLQMLIGSVPDGYELEELNDMLKGILEQYVDLAEPIVYDIDGNEMQAPEREKTFDFNEDAELIFASFYQAYKIDLIEEQGRLHWSKFMALFQGLPDDTIMRQVMQIRSWTPQDDKRTKAQVMSRLKAHYSLYKGGDVDDE